MAADDQALTYVTLGMCNFTLMVAFFLIHYLTNFPRFLNYANVQKTTQIYFILFPPIGEDCKDCIKYKQITLYLISNSLSVNN